MVPAAPSGYFGRNVPKFTRRDVTSRKHCGSRGTAQAESSICVNEGGANSSRYALKAFLTQSSARTFRDNPGQATVTLGQRVSSAGGSAAQANVTRRPGAEESIAASTSVCMRTASQKVGAIFVPFEVSAPFSADRKSHYRSLRSCDPPSTIRNVVDATTDLTPLVRG